MAGPTDPPKALGTAQVLATARVSDPSSFQGSSLLVDGDPIGPVPLLAIAQAFDSSEIQLLRCDPDWRLLGVSCHASRADAIACAEFEYSGSSALWVDTGYSLAEAKAFREQSWGDLRCSVCGRTPDEFQSLATTGSASLCDECEAERDHSPR